MATDNLRREINFEKFKKHYPNEFLEMQTELLFVLYTNPLILKNKNTYIFGENVKSKRHEKERWWDIVKQWLVRRSSHITEYKGGCFALLCDDDDDDDTKKSLNNLISLIRIIYEMVLQIFSFSRRVPRFLRISPSHPRRPRLPLSGTRIHLICPTTN